MTMRTQVAIWDGILQISMTVGCGFRHPSFCKHVTYHNLNYSNNRGQCKHFSYPSFLLIPNSLLLPSRCDS